MRKKYKAIIVEDEESSRKLLSFLIMEMDTGFDVTAELRNGKEALDYLQSLTEEELPDLILTDIRMPFVDGLSLAEQVKDHYPKCYLVIVTAYDEFEYARRGIQLGVRDFILKPFNRNELFKSMQTISRELMQKEPGFGEKKSVIERVWAYIDTNLSDPDLSLSSVAAAFFLNPSYLSREFGKETSMTFSDYLVKKRIEKAVFYLENTDLYAYEISEKVGFRDAKYFGKCFKKVTGVSFSEYRNLN